MRAEPPHNNYVAVVTVAALPGDLAGGRSSGVSVIIRYSLVYGLPATGLDASARLTVFRHGTLTSRRAFRAVGLLLAINWSAAVTFLSRL